MLILFSFLNAAAVSLNNVLGGLASRILPVPVVMAVASTTSLGIAFVLATLGGGATSNQGLATGMLAGAIGGIGIPLAYRSLALGPVGITATVIACVSTGVVATTGMVLGADAGPARTAGLVLCVLAVILVSWRTGERASATSPAIVMAAAAGIAFGLFVVTMNTAPPTGGWWPLLAVRISVCVVAAALLISILRTAHGRSSFGRPRSRAGLAAAMAAGTVDVGANVFLILALRGGDLLVVAIVTSVAPVLTAALGWLLFRESLTRLQIAGVVSAVMAVAATSL